MDAHLLEYRSCTRYGGLCGLGRCTKEWQLLPSMQCYHPLPFCGADELRPPFQVFVKTLTGKTLTLDCDAKRPILELKKLVNQSEGYPVCQIIFIFAGKQLQSDMTTVYRKKLRFTS